MSDVLALLLRINLAMAAAVGVVLVLRGPARRLFGPRLAYGAWSLVPLAALAMLAPPRMVTVMAPPVVVSAPAALAAPAAASSAQAGLNQTMPAQTGPDLWAGLTALWIAGAAAGLAHLAWRQAQFDRAARDGRAGPAVVGVLRPRIVVPADFARRYTPREQTVVLAHEQSHIARQDSRINALVAIVAAVNWFNPAVRLFAHQLRIDQEFACDAQVVAAHPTARRCYAEALVKAQLAARPLPLGCYWPAASVHPLAQRVGLLAWPAPSPGRRRLGSAAMALLGLAGALSAWAARPTDVVLVRTTLTRSAEPAADPIAASPSQAAASRVGPAPSARSPVVPTLAVAGPVAVPAPAPEPVVVVADPVAVQPDVATPAAFPTHRIRAAALRSAVDPGSAVRVVATMVDRDGVPLITDLTAFGSQAVYRTGYFQRGASRYALFTSVMQEGDRLWVTASLDRRFRPETTGSIELASGATGRITLGDGQVVTVTPTLRAETAQEKAEGERALSRFDRTGRPQIEPEPR